MKKWIALVLAAMMIFSVTAVFAQETETTEEIVPQVQPTEDKQAKEADPVPESSFSYVPAHAELIEEKQKKNKVEKTYWDAKERAEYVIETDVTGQNIMSVEFESADDRGGRTAVLTEQEVWAVVQAKWASAVMEAVWLDSDDGFYTYEVKFSGDDYTGQCSMDPETGRFLEWEISFQKRAETSRGILSERDAEKIVLRRLPDGKILYIETDSEDGLVIYEGKAKEGKWLYEFEIDAVSGEIIEWERESYKDKPEKTSKPYDFSGHHGCDKHEHSFSFSDDDERLIGTAKARKIASAYAGDGRVLKIKLSAKGKTPVYRGLVAGEKGVFEFKIDAETGEMIGWELDREKSFDD